MAAVINATPMDANANAYCTLVEARAYYDTNLYATDVQLQDDTKLTKGIITATSLIDEGFSWLGTPATTLQALCFPRWGLFELSGRLIVQTTIPQKVKDATAELARQLLLSDRTADNDLETLGVKELNVEGAVRLRFDQPIAKVLPDRVVNMLLQWGIPRLERGMAKVTRC
jgi:hypothetical protein